MGDRSIRVGTRGSRLALFQAELVRRGLGSESELVVIASTGDLHPELDLAGRADSGLFTRRIDEELLGCEIDVAVHSLKDLPTQETPGLVIAAFLPRGPSSDLLIVDPRRHEPGMPMGLSQGCRVGTASLRRQALLARFAPQARPAFMRGNVPTRVARCRDGEYGALIVARAGVERLELDLTGLEQRELDPDVWIPAPGQGVIVAVCRAGDTRILECLRALDDPASRAAAGIERALLASFGAGCHSAFGARVTAAGELWKAIVGRQDGTDGWVTACRIGTDEDMRRAAPGDFTGWSRAGWGAVLGEPR